MNCRQVNLEDLHWTQPTQCMFQGFCDAVYETVALLVRSFRSDAYVRIAHNIVQLRHRLISIFKHPVCWSRP